ncbi:hypothetical protein QYE76_057032 [Lolium multiflorum]|uniref:Reverse transcriptase domain-containing protein n=1 Tax=Lolium multiflorum TaxID=4521 RepID=A0AAD8WQF4_LOLMU|nr:hypothetical protein QYE76_057032 [Lolium multiflorum]
MFPHHQADIVSRHDFFFEGLKIQVHPWRLEDNAEQVNLRQHVRLCIENVVLYAWNRFSAQQAIGNGCSLDYIKDACVRREYTKALCVWAWVEHLGLVPRVSWVTLPGPDAAPSVRERGLQKRCIVHLDIFEDLTNEDAPMPSKGTWRWGVMDGEEFMRVRGERINDNNRDSRRMDEDDNHDRRGCSGGRGWRDAIRRSLSRNGRSGVRDVLHHAALLIILHLDMAQELRSLSYEERALRAELQRKVVSLAVIERDRKRQCSRITNIREGDANTKFFHRKVNERRRKNHIHRLKHKNGWITDHNYKEKIISDHFGDVMGRGQNHHKDFNRAGLHFEAPDLASLDDPFTEEEVKHDVNLLPGDKAPGPDGFTGAFYKLCWDIIRHDVMRAINLFGDLHVANFHWLNSANIALLPKKDGAEEISDFRPISLIHGIAKIIAKMFSLRLAPHMDDLVSIAQSAFIKKRSIHDNFLYVKNLATRLHKRKTPALLFKLDIRKAFDSVHWDYIIDLLQKRGFPHASGIGWSSCLSPPHRGSSLMGWPANLSSMAGGYVKGTLCHLSFLSLL